MERTANKRIIMKVFLPVTCLFHMSSCSGKRKEKKEEKTGFERIEEDKETGKVRITKEGAQKLLQGADPTPDKEEAECEGCEIQDIPSVRHGEAEVKGSLPKEAIRRVVRQHLNELGYCYEKELADKPDLAGEVVVQFAISPNGAVQSSQVKSSNMNSEELEVCVAESFKRWTFPPSKKGDVVDVKCPVHMKPFTVIKNNGRYGIGW